MDPVGHERATIIIKRQDPVTGNDYYTYPDPEIGVNDQSVDPTPLIRNYLHESPDRLFLHTHGKYDPRFESNHFSEIGDLSASDHYKIQLGLISPDGNSQIYDGRSGIRGQVRKFPPPQGIVIPKDESRYGIPIIGFLRRIFDK